MASFYENLKIICKEKKTTPTTIAKSLGHGNSTAANWKNGSVPRGDIVAEIAEYLNVSADYLLTGKDFTPAPTVDDLGDLDKEILAVCLQMNTRQKAELLTRAYEIKEGK